MATSARSNRGAPARVPLRTIALPIEHGGWGFTLEPVLLGFLVAPSVSAWGLAVAALAVFLARRPVKLVLTDIVRGRRLPRTTAAGAFAAGYSVLAIAGLAGALVTADRRFLVAYGVAAPFTLLALQADSKSKSRTLRAEISGATAMSATVTAMALADGWAYPVAFGLWLVLVARAVTTISLVRAQIRRLHDRPVGDRAVFAVCLAAVAVMAALASLDVVPWLATVAIAGIGLLAYVLLRRPPVPARVIGWTQMATGGGVVMLTAAGVWLGW